MKHTKKALFTSIVALLLCFTMLMGTTFAWFTDTATVNVNQIVSGKLDLELVKDDGSAYKEGETINFVSADPAGQPEEILWEPGATYVTNGFKIKNNGNLAFKFKVVITDTNLSGDTKLLDAIKFDLVSKAEGYTDYTVYDGAEGIVLPDEGKNLDEKTFYLRGTMDTAAGNEYKGLTLSGIIITVYATQYTYEYDSEDNLYDEDAEYDDGTAGGETNPDPEPTVDKTALNKAIEDAGKLKADDYVDFSAVTEAVEAANNLPANATQEQVDAAAKAITDAITALQDKPVTPPAPTTSNISVTYVDAPASANVTNINTTAEYEEAYSFNVPSVDYYTVTVKQGETDVTASVADGKYTFNPNEENYNFTVTYTENVIMTITPIEGYLGSNVWAGDKSNMMFVDGATKLDEFFAAMQVENAVLRMYVTEGTVNEVFIQADEFGWGGYGCSGISVVDGVLSIKCSDILNATINGELTSERINKWNNSGKNWGYVLFTGTQDNYTKLSNIVIVKP